MKNRNLEGIRVLDLSRLLPGPYATQLLANMGAEVVKIERPPEGDYARAMPPYISVKETTLDAAEEDVFGAIFWRNNQGKKSVALDFDQPDERELLLRLCEHADVFIESFRPGTLARRGLDYAGVSARNPKLVYCSLSGYGQTGPYAGRAGHDNNYLALAGILKLNGAADAPPVSSSVLMADLAGGARAALAIVAALLERERTGEGSFLDVALFDAAVEWMGTVDGALYRAKGENPRRGEGFLTGAYPCYHIYETRDGEFMSLGALEPRFWHAFCAAAERADLADAQFDAEAIPRLAALFRTRTRSEWTALAQDADCCLEPLLDVSETLEHPQVVARGLAQGEGRVPRLGGDTEAVLREWGIDRKNGG